MKHMLWHQFKWRPLTATCVGVVVALAASDVVAQVDCNAGGSINLALQTQQDVQFTGTCNEFVNIFRDDTAILGVSGDRSLDVINGGLSANGKTAVMLRNLTITGSDGNLFDGNNGIFITNGAFVEFRNVEVRDTENGTFVVRNAGMRIRDSEFGPALVDDADFSCNPICVGDNSYVRIERTNITGDTNDALIGGALVAFRDASIIVRGGSTITNTGSEPALNIVADSSLRMDKANSPINNVVNGGLVVFGNSYTEIAAGAIIGAVSVNLNSTLRLAGPVFGADPSSVSIEGNIVLRRDASMLVSNPAVTINGSITCLDDESSLEGTFQGNNTVSCTDYNQPRGDDDD